MAGRTRDESGTFAQLRGFAAHVRPVFMLPAVGTAVYGAALAPAVDPGLAGLHAAAVGVALFVAHLRDGHVDGHRRGEEPPLLPERTYRLAVPAVATGGLALAGSLVALANPLAGLSVVALLGLALLHAPHLDRHPVTVTVDYPAGIALAMLGGYAAQTGSLAPGVLAGAAVLATLLAGIKVGIDTLDAPFDRTVGKRTVPVLLGPDRARWVAAAVFAATAIATVGLVAAGPLSPAGLAATAAALGCLGASLALAPRRAVRAQMLLTYVFAAALFVSVCAPGCAGQSLVESLPFDAVEHL